MTVCFRLLLDDYKTPKEEDEWQKKQLEIALKLGFVITGDED